jgi:hypothetical protein
MREPDATTRRDFVGRLTTGAIALGVGAALTPAAAFAASPTPDETAPAQKWDNSWLNGIRGNHAQIFDMPAPNGGLGLLHVQNYVDTYKDALGMSYPNVVAIVSLYGMTTPLAFNDAMWAKYHFGDLLKVNDRTTKAVALRNVFDAAGMAGAPLGAEYAREIPGTSSIASLQSRGVRFILCNNALNFWVGRLAAGSGGNTTTIRNDLLANTLPKVVLVPAMVIAFNQAQTAGASYMFLT